MNTINRTAGVIGVGGGRQLHGMTARCEGRMRTSTTHHVDAVASLAKAALRAARANAPGKQVDRYVGQLAKDVLSRPRSRCVHQIFALCFDLVDRGAPLEHCEELGNLLLAAVRERHAERQVPVTISLEAAHLAEEQAQGEMELAETALIHDRSTANVARYVMAQGRYVRANDALYRIVRRMQVRDAVA